MGESGLQEPPFCNHRPEKCHNNMKMPVLHPFGPVNCLFLSADPQSDFDVMRRSSSQISLKLATSSHDASRFTSCHLFLIHIRHM